MEVKTFSTQIGIDHQKVTKSRAEGFAGSHPLKAQSRDKNRASEHKSDIKFELLVSWRAKL